MTATATPIAAGDLSQRVPESRPGHRGRRARRRPQPDARADRERVRRARAESRGAAAPVRRRRLARAAHAGHHDPRLRRAVPARRAGRATTSSTRRCGAPSRRPCAWAASSTTCSRSPSSTRAGRSTRGRSTSPLLASDAAADARAAAPDACHHARRAGRHGVVIGDEDRLRQVVANLVGNALVHTTADAPIEMRVDRGRRSDAVLEVDDRGPGMAPEVAERVIERFYRADPARSRHRGGSGLGLSIVDATVAAHGGSVDIDSEQGRGTTVRLTMPAAPDRTIDALQRGRHTRAGTGGRRAATRTGRRRWLRTPPARPRRAASSRSSTRRSIDGDPDPGEIVWTWVPYEEDPSQGKDRPVVIIGRRGDMLVGVPLTTKRDDREPQVEVGTGDWDSRAPGRATPGSGGCSTSTRTRCAARVRSSTPARRSSTSSRQSTSTTTCACRNADADRRKPATNFRRAAVTSGLGERRLLCGAWRTDPRTIRIGLLGCGNVGAAFVAARRRARRRRSRPAPACASRSPVSPCATSSRERGIATAGGRADPRRRWPSSRIPTSTSSSR